MTSRRLLIAAVLALASFQGQAQSPSSVRFSADMPEMLQIDALTVVSYNMLHELAVPVCARLGSPLDKEVSEQVVRWKARNDAYVKSAAGALDAFAARETAASGPQAGKTYSENALAAVVTEVTAALRRLFKDADPDNKIVPDKAACENYVGKLRAGGYDFRNMPKVTQALTPYMQKK